MGEILSQARELMQEQAAVTWIVSLISAVLLTIFLKAGLQAVATRLKVYSSRTVSPWDDIVADTVLVTRAWTIFAWIAYLVTQPLVDAPAIKTIARGSIVFVTAAQMMIWGLQFLRSWQTDYIRRKAAKDMTSIAALGLLFTTLRILAIVLIVLIGLSNLGVDVAALVTGLGIGGIAVALAAQNILGDLLASLSIVLDKPFQVGDFIAAGSDNGTVENIGIKTTRVRSLSGEELIFSNKDLLESRVRNFKRMAQRRVVHQFNIVYATPSEMLDRIPVWTKEFIESVPLFKFDRCHLARFGSSSLEYELVFFVEDPDYNLYMDRQQDLLIRLFKKLRAENVEFALPSQSVYVERVTAAAQVMAAQVIVASNSHQ